MYVIEVFKGKLIGFASILYNILFLINNEKWLKHNDKLFSVGSNRNNTMCCTKNIYIFNNYKVVVIHNIINSELIY